jgi:hypothetical protein
VSRRDSPDTIYDYPVERLTEISPVLLLGVAEWGRGDGPKAWMLIGTAVRSESKPPS